ncbi:MAG TPA: bacillithiol biosynthesis BshC, partial [Paenibacillus sp.]
MDKYGLSFQDVQHHLQERRSQWLSEQDTVHIDTQFEATRKAFEQLYEPLIQQLGDLQAGLLTLGENNKSKILDQITYMERKAKEALEQRHEATLRQWDRIETLLFPLGQPQERVYNLFHYANRYGVSFISKIMEISVDYSGEHRIIYL